MTKKDYELVAAVFAEHVAAYKELGDTKEVADKLNAIGIVVAALSREFETDNPRFLRGKFVAACGFVPFHGVGK